MSYNWDITKKLHVKVEPYFQYLYNIQVVKNSTQSLINLSCDWFINDRYVNTSKGHNYGIDLSLEQYISNGFYYLIPASIFDSKNGITLNLIKISFLIR